MASSFGVLFGGFTSLAVLSKNGLKIVCSSEAGFYTTAFLSVSASVSLLLPLLLSVCLSVAMPLLFGAHWVCGNHNNSGARSHGKLPGCGARMKLLSAGSVVVVGAAVVCRFGFDTHPHPGEIVFRV
jgi:hypothetical protein